jgi:hypothetical protein
MLSHESACLVDPDFDEDWGWGSLLEHEVQATGVIPLHPDGNRRNGTDDPVPLHTRVYGDGDVAELVKREWAAHLENRKRWKAEREKRRESWESLPALATREMDLPKPSPSATKTVVVETDQRDEDGWTYTQKLAPEHRAQSVYHTIKHYCIERSHPHFDLIVAMRLHAPIMRGQGRVLDDHVMVNESDLAKWNADRARRALVEVWRGHGLVIFKLR